MLSVGFEHAFFTRQGGVSSGPYRSLNFSSAVGDAPENVARNLELAASILGISPDFICYLSQIHSRRVVILDKDAHRAQTLSQEGDAVLSTFSHQACAVRTADCVPVLLGCKKTGWAAAVHAGWRGCVRGIVPQTVSSLHECGASDLVAAIGPHISQDAFEVSEEVAHQLADASPGPDIVERRHPRPHVSLRDLVRAQLKQAGVAENQIDDVVGCTFLQPELFFSFRRDGKLSGRHLSAIVPRSGAPPSPAPSAKTGSDR